MKMKHDSVFIHDISYKYIICIKIERGAYTHKIMDFEIDGAS